MRGPFHIRSVDDGRGRRRVANVSRRHEPCEVEPVNRVPQPEYAGVSTVAARRLKPIAAGFPRDQRPRGGRRGRRDLLLPRYQRCS